uniref:Pentraxin n=1 Tax=Periophthalmus magnuspinnatus TaxID=409849 RepID=A0A3B4B0J4_9GOBI
FQFTIIICLISLLVLASSSSLWGKKLEFKSSSCLWQLSPDTVIPALEELSVCLLLRTAADTEWTAFVYKAPGSRNIELGLQGKGDLLSLWLFGNKTQVEKRLNRYEWHSVCTTWSGKLQKLQLYINGTKEASNYLETTTLTHLAPGGTLTLGRSHFLREKTVQPEFGNNDQVLCVFWDFQNNGLMLIILTWSSEMFAAFVMFCVCFRWTRRMEREGL